MSNDIVQYSECHSQSGGHVCFSPNGRFIATAAGYRLIVRDVDTLQIVQLYGCCDAIEGIEWSCDSAYVLCSIPKRGAAQVWSVSNKEWHCKIDEGPVGLAHARFSPDGRHVLATADFRLRITIWSLCDRSVYYICFPKLVSKGLDFTRDGTVMALAERTDARDSVGLFLTDGWKPLRTFTVASTDLEDLKWNPTGDVLAVIDSILQYQVLLYSAAGQLLQSYRPYDHALGVKTFAWHPLGHLLAIGSYDERARLLNSLTWQRLAECSHPAEVRDSFSEDGVAWIEPEGDGGGYAAQRLPLTVPSERPNPDKAHPKLGVGHLEWSAGGRFLATRNDNMPRALWVWDGATLLLHSVLLQVGHVRAAAWHPTQQLLALCTGASKLFMWSPRGCRTAPLPVAHELAVSEVQWNASGDALLLLDADRFCVCFVTLPPEPPLGEEVVPGPAPLTVDEEQMLRAAGEHASSTSKAPRTMGGEESSDSLQSYHEGVDPQVVADAFALMDVNHDGALSRIEVIKAVRTQQSVRDLLGLGPVLRQEDGSREQFEAIFQRLDADDSKTISLDEFMAAFIGQAPGGTPWHSARWVADADDTDEAIEVA